MYAGKKIIVGRDKLDHIKGVQHKLNAYEKFLEMYPEWQNKVQYTEEFCVPALTKSCLIQVVLIQVTSPPPRPSPILESKVSEIVSRINGTYGSIEFAPVHHYHQHLDQDEYYSLLSTADVGLITSVRDGMNTTSHEFVVCQQVCARRPPDVVFSKNCIHMFHDFQESQGVLILSEFTGTAGSLSSTILVNPFDYVGVANAIKEALEMCREEKFNKHQVRFLPRLS